MCFVGARRFQSQETGQLGQSAGSHGCVHPMCFQTLWRITTSCGASLTKLWRRSSFQTGRLFPARVRVVVTFRPVRTFQATGQVWTFPVRQMWCRPKYSSKKDPPLACLGRLELWEELQLTHRRHTKNLAGTMGDPRFTRQIVTRATQRFKVLLGQETVSGELAPGHLPGLSVEI